MVVLLIDILRREASQQRTVTDRDYNNDRNGGKTTPGYDVMYESVSKRRILSRCRWGLLRIDSFESRPLGRSRSGWMQKKTRMTANQSSSKIQDRQEEEPANLSLLNTLPQTPQ